MRSIRPSTCFLLVVAIFAWPLALRAHEGHGGKEVGAFDLDAPRQVSPETAAHIGLKTAEVDFGPVEDTLALSGFVRAVPDRHWTISTRTAGKVIAVHKQVGDTVRRGELLVEIDSPELAKLMLDVVRGEGRIEQLRVEAKNADETALLAEAELRRVEAAGESAVPLNVISERRAAALRARGEARLKAVDLEVTVKEVAVLKQQALRWSRDVVGAEADSKSLEPSESQPVNLLRLVAPADGVVVERSAQPGQWATAGEPLMAVADHSVMQIEGELPESLISRVVSRSSDAVRVRTPADPKYLGAGRIKFISPVLDQVKRTAHVLIETPNEIGTLRSGMFVDLTIVLREEKTAVVVPASAVVQYGPMHFVFIKSGEFFKKQDITPGLSNDQAVEVLAGLAPGDVVVTQGAYSLTQLRPKAPTALAMATPAGIAAPRKP
ncbi:MAG: efflux RND transporter periplasmic adaptor subunit [Phycisphaerae bacterium]|nr:efflux RND transporter periplasmic adaptor subunit [Phycisphaerae bacterium]